MHLFIFIIGQWHLLVHSTTRPRRRAGRRTPWQSPPPHVAPLKFPQLHNHTRHTWHTHTHTFHIGHFQIVAKRLVAASPGTAQPRRHDRLMVRAAVPAFLRAFLRALPTCLPTKNGLLRVHSARRETAEHTKSGIEYL